MGRKAQMAISWYPVVTPILSQAALVMILLLDQTLSKCREPFDRRDRMVYPQSRVYCLRRFCEELPRWRTIIFTSSAPHE